MHRGDERHGQCRHRPVIDFIGMPMARRIAPAERQNAVEHAPALRRRAVTQGGEIGNEARIPEDDGKKQIGQNGPEIPDQCAAPLRPQTHRVGIGKQPVEIGRPAHVQERKYTRNGHGHQRHSLGEAVDRGAPFLMRQEQHGRNQRTGVADADPPDVVGDRKNPTRRSNCCRECRCRRSADRPHRRRRRRSSAAKRRARSTSASSARCREAVR